MRNEIPVYIINLKKRTERREHITAEFEEKAGFKITIVEAIADKNGRQGLWNTIHKIITEAKQENRANIILCEDDHQFTKKYNFNSLNSLIDKANENKADILSGGVSWCKTAVQISADLFWIDQFSGLQFTVIFKRFYDTILEANFTAMDAADYKISELSNNKMVISPFISVQKEFGYSDVTSRNNTAGYVSEIFKKAAAVFRQLDKVKKFYQALPLADLTVLSDEYDQIQLPVYVINLSERIERLEHIKAQFRGREEFELKIIEACKDTIGAVGLWRSIVKVIQLAIENDDDVIVISEDDHQFTSDYSKEFLLRNIIEASEQGADILSGGAGSFGQAVPITRERYWINPMFSTQFIVIYSKFFQTILNYQFKETDTADGVFSVLTSHKMLLSPYISIQRDFGYSDITQIHNDMPGLVCDMFNKSQKRLQSIKDTAQRYQEAI